MYYERYIDCTTKLIYIHDDDERYSKPLYMMTTRDLLRPTVFLSIGQYSTHGNESELSKTCSVRPLLAMREKTAFDAA